MSDTQPTLAIASSNRGKIAEFRALLGAGVTVVSLADLGLDSPEETGDTFEVNAALKARYVHDRTGLPVLADDSGLEVDALGGLPGVRSARFSGVTATDAGNRELLLRSMAHVPDNARSARFVCVIALVDRFGDVYLTRGTCDGAIAFAERGVHGFGYDAVFSLPDGRTMAELPPEEKNLISHRSQALRLAGPEIRRVLGIGAS